MKSIRYLIVLITVAGSAWAQRSANPYTTPQSEAPNVASPIGQKPTSIPAQGAIERPSYRPNSANDIVTGNVGGLGAFHGTLPYNVQSQLGAGLSDSGSGSVRSFLRRSSGLPYAPVYGDSSKPYYDPMQATTSFRPGELSGLSRPVVTTPSSIARISVPEWTDLQRMSQPMRPVWQETTELESVVMQQMGLRELALMEEQLNKLDPGQLERLNPRLRQLMETTGEQAKTGKETPNLLFDESMRPVQPDKPVEPVKLTEAERLRIQRDQIEQMRKELETLLEPETDTRNQPKPKAEPEPAPQAPEKKTSAEKKSALPPLPSSSSETTPTPAAEPEKPVEAVDKPFRLPSPEQRTRIRQLLGPYKNFEALTADKTADYLRQGDQFMVKRQYYRAADAYTLATVWQGDNPQIYLKQSFALFAAGAYLSSAQSLQQALYLKPELATEKIDFWGYLGGPVTAAGSASDSDRIVKTENQDLYDSRMKEVSLFLKTSDSGMLALLMAYMYSQYSQKEIDFAKAQELLSKTEKDLAKSQEASTNAQKSFSNAQEALRKAKTVIEISVFRNPDDPAVTAMKKLLLPDAASSKATP
jgi:hypothetical protein